MPEIEVSFPDIFQGFIQANIAKNQVGVDIRCNKLMPVSGWPIWGPVIVSPEPSAVTRGLESEANRCMFSWCQCYEQAEARVSGIPVGYSGILWGHWGLLQGTFGWLNCADGALRGALGLFNFILGLLGDAGYLRIRFIQNSEDCYFLLESKISDLTDQKFSDLRS